MAAIKKFIRFIFTFLLFILIINLSPLYGQATSISIKSWLVDSILMENGDLVLKEDLTFNFEGKYNGVFRNLLLDGSQDLEDIQIAEVINGQEIIYSHSNKAKNGDENLYTIREEMDGINIKIFAPSKDQDKTFRISYIIKGLALKYRDTGELYYKFIGQENDTPIDYFRADIKLPRPKNDRVEIFAHGPLNGIIDFKNNSSIQIQVEKINPRTLVEARILFPTDFIPDSKNIVAIDNYENIINEELAYVENLENKRIKKEANKKTFNNIALLTSGLIAILTSLIFSKFRRNMDFFDTMDEGLNLDDYTPAVVGYLNSNMLTINTLIATIFDLARKGFLTIENLGKYKRKTNNFQLTRLDKDPAPLADHEKFLLNWFFNDIAKASTITSKDMEDYGKKKRKNFANSYNAWSKQVKEDAESKGFYDKRGKKPGIFLIIIGIISFLISIFSVLVENFYGIILFLLSIFAFIYGLILYYRKSDYGYIENKKWKNFKKELKWRGDSLDTSDLNLPLDAALIYGLVLKVNNKSLKAFKSLIPESSQPNHWVYWYFATSSRGQNSFAASLNKSMSATGTSTGSGGGFSAGGGGGAGGGGAGGF